MYVVFMMWSSTYHKKIITVVVVVYQLILHCHGNALPLVINTWAFTNATAAAWNSLKSGLSAEDSLVIGCSECETQQCDGSVGYGNHPDESGEVTLDAMIMDGNTMAVGAVGDLKRVKNAIGVAHAVLKYTDHTLLAGESATQFAKGMGFKEESLSTNQSKADYTRWLKGDCQPNFRKDVTPDPKKKCGPYKPNSFKKQQLLQPRHHPEIDSTNHDTIGMIVIDSNFHIWAGTTTNGANHKVPGRIGDSPIMGAGAYANSLVGAAAATGDGDVMMRFLPSFKAVSLMEMGVPPDQAAAKAIEPISKFYPSYSGAVIAVNSSGSFGAACHGFEEFPYSVASAQFGGVQVFKVQCIKAKLT